MTNTTLMWIWAQQALGVGSSWAAKLLADPQRLERFYQADRSRLERRGFSSLQMERLCDKSLEPAARIVEQMQRLGGHIYTPDSPDYPTLLRVIFSPPLVLYALGQLPDFSAQPGVAVVGTRHAGEYGLRTAETIAAGLAAGGAIVVSGGAEGVDTAAHIGALNAGGITVAVQGCGLAVNYPQSNRGLRERIVRQGGCVLSEMPPFYRGSKYSFPLRNRILSGLSRGVCVIEAPTKSGSLITARHAREQGRDVFAVPGEIGTGRNDGSNELIRQGATLVSRAEDILREYQQDYPVILNLQNAQSAQYAVSRQAEKMPPAPPPVRMSRQVSHQVKTHAPAVACPDGVGEEARRLFSLLTEEPQPVDWFVQQMQLPIAQVLTLLTELELFGGVKVCPGQLYRLP